MTARFMATIRSAPFWWSAVIVWFVALFILSSISTLPQGPKIANIDKIEHTVYYALGATCFYLARRFRNAALTGTAAAVSAVLFCMAIGAFDEWHQTFTPGRSGNDPFDWMADTLGGFLGALCGWLAHRMLAAGTPTLTKR